MSHEPLRYHLRFEGVVQGVGFRPFVHRLAQAQCLSGWVLNTGLAVEAEVQGPLARLRAWMIALRCELPEGARLDRLSLREVPALVDDPQGAFVIRPSENQGVDGLVLSPDRALCEDCRREVLDPNHRRYRYPFTTCARCGPRYTLARSLPFDRARTTMAAFAMCAECAAEYMDPADRRFHAQTNACSQCGPKLEGREGRGSNLDLSGEAALSAAVEALRAGLVVAVKGVGGFHLMVDAQNERAVERLRAGKGREAKPFAVMMSSLAQAERYCEVSAVERAALTSEVAPIVLLQRKAEGLSLAEGVAPGLRVYGLMLAHTPLHVLLLEDFGGPLVATSGNRSEEPICFDNEEALARLQGVADFFLLHDRTIVHGLDDSILRQMGEAMTVFRRGRGLCPAALEPLKCDQNKNGENKLNVLAYGGQGKSALALASRRKVYLGPHLGQLDGLVGEQALEREVNRLPAFHGVAVERVACDRHAEYFSTQLAERSAYPVQQVQHHLAHIRSCLLDNDHSGPVLGVAWDGSGDGGEGELWGGEFLVVDEAPGARRVGSLRPVRWLGGEIAAHEPRRMALASLHALWGDELWARLPQPLRAAFTASELEVLRTLLRTGLCSPYGTSMGRLFDAAAALIGLRFKAEYEGQAAMELESQAAMSVDRERTPFSCALVRAPAVASAGAPEWWLDFGPLLEALLEQKASGRCSVARLAAGFHLGLAEGLCAMAERVGLPTVALSGGVFQNRFLTEAVMERLRERGFTVLCHRRLPPNDGGLAAGQVMEALCV